MSEERLIKEAKVKLSNAATAVETTISNGRKRAKDRRTAGHYQSTLDRLNVNWNEYKKAMSDVKLVISDEEELEELNTAYSELDLKCSEYVSDLYDGLSSTGGSKSASAPKIVTSAATNIQLPRIQLPKFDGNYDNWKAFSDLFKSMVHNDDSLEEVQKLHYLKGCLTNEAERLLKNVPITNDDYKPAWEKLVSRYENKRILINTHVKRLINQEKLKSETSKALRGLIDTTEECLQQISALNVNTSTWDVILIHILVKKLPIETIKLWEEDIGISEELPTLDQFKKFIQTRSRVLECVSSTIGTATATPNPTKCMYATQPGSQEAYKSGKKCPACNKAHFITKCDVFKKMTVQERRQCIAKAKLCYNCFSSKHVVHKCSSNYTCRHCNKKHNTWLHVEQQQQSSTNTAEGVSPTPGPSHTQNYFSAPQSTVLLATAQVEIKDICGEAILMRCLIDPGSEASFISEHAARKLGLPRSPAKLEVNSLNGNTTAWIKSKMQVALQSCVHQTEVIQAEVFIINNIAESIPSNTIECHNEWNYLVQLTLADPCYWVSRPVDLLLGAGVFSQILQNGLVKGQNNGPTAVNTAFGWVLLGGETHSNQAMTYSAHKTIQEVNFELQRFWEIEEVSHVIPLSEDDQQCENHFESTHTRLTNGKYQVRLPFKHPPNTGSTRNLALRQFQALERRFQANQELKETYSLCIEEYLSLGHMVKCPSDFVGYHLPHHPVFKDSTTTKVRVVFNGGALSNIKESLNGQLLTGPRLQAKLFSTLLKWRKYKVAITGDIEKMYRMIELHPEDQQFQKIIWRDKETGDIQDYQLTTVTFGTSSAPYLAIKTLQQLAEDEKLNFPLAYRAAMNDFYVDDLLTGADDINTAKNIRDQCIQMLKTGHFNLRKWSSNKVELLEDLPAEDVEISKFLQFNEDEAVKTLGIRWNPKTDTFSFVVKNRNGSSDKVTKRTIFSEIASLYDPLGWIAPIIVRAKILIQELWTAGFDWDVEINKALKDKWLEFKTQLMEVERVKIPRWIGHVTTISNVCLHGFSDASMQAYGAVVYFCVEVNGQKMSTLLTAKTKVAPVKPVTIPRLELSGALLLAKLLSQSVKDMCISGVRTLGWCDSTIVLHWIKSHPRNWKTYVANRVAEIQEMLKPENWRHVPTKQNPADLASRGETSSNLINSSLWWQGPDWLTQPETNWPVSDAITQGIELEAKPKPTITMMASMKRDDLPKYTRFMASLGSETKPTITMLTKIETDEVSQYPRFMAKLRTKPNPIVTMMASVEADALPKYNSFLANLEAKTKPINPITANTDADVLTKYASFIRLKRIVALLRRFCHNCRNKSQKITGPLSVDELSEATTTIIRTVQQTCLSEEYNQLKTNKELSTKSRWIQLSPFLDDQMIIRVGGRLQHATITYNQMHPAILPIDHHVTRILIHLTHLTTLHGGTTLVLNTFRQSYWVLKGRRTISNIINRCVICVRHRQKTRSQLMGQLPADRVNINSAFENVGIDFAGPIFVKTSSLRNARAVKAYFCVFVCMATKAVHVEAVCDLSTEAFMAALRRFIARRGMCRTIYSDCGSNFKGAKVVIDKEIKEAFINATKSVQEYCGTHYGITWKFNPPAAPSFGGLWESTVKSVKHHLIRTIGIQRLTFEEFSTLLAQIEACLNSRPLCKIENSVEDLEVLTPGHFLIGRALNAIPQPELDPTITNQRRWKYIQVLVQGFWRKWVRDYLNTLQQRPKWYKPQPNLKIGDIVLLKNEQLSPTYWPLAKVTKAIPGNDGLVRVVTVKTATSEFDRAVTKICSLPIQE